MMSLDRAELRAALDEVGADAWLLFDFHGLNPVAKRVLGLGGMGTRRIFVFLPKDGEFTAVAHKIELAPVQDFPGKVIPYARWQELQEALRPLVQGKRLAMEVSPKDAVPYLDRVPHGVVQMLESLGATIVPSGEMVTRYAARWTEAETADHLFAAEVLASVAKAELAKAVHEGGTGLTETALQQRVVDAVKAKGCVFDTLPVVGFGPNAADPHYGPVAGKDATLGKDTVILLDLWAGKRLGTVFADQTWMGFSGKNVPTKVQEVWTVVRDGRDAAIRRVLETVKAGRPLAGFEVDRAARDHIEGKGWGKYFVHRTGHSIDQDLHGSGPHMDDYETHDERRLMPGVGFSIEPGVYITGEFGVRSEVNMFWAAGGPRVTPAEPQRDLITQ